MSPVRFRKEQRLFIGPRQGNCVGLYSIAVDPDRRRLYMVNVHTPNIAVVDARTGRYIKSIKLSEREYHFFAEVMRHPHTGNLLVSSNYHNSMWMVDTRRDRVMKTVKTGGFPGGVAVHGRSGKIYVANGRDGTVGVYDPGGKLLKTIPVPPWPYPLDVDSKNNRLYGNIRRLCWENPVLGT